MATGSKVDIAVSERPYQKLMSELAQIAELDAVSGDKSGFDIATEVVDNIMEAESIDDVFVVNDSGPKDISDYSNMPLSVFNPRFRRSEEKYRKNGLGVFVIFDAMTDAGEFVTISTGAVNVVASIRKIQTLGGAKEESPTRLKIVSREVGNGTLYTVGKA